MRKLILIVAALLIAAPSFGQSGSPYIAKPSLGTDLSTATGVLAPANGGTGVANGTANLVTFTGNFGLGLTLSAGTALTLPTSGTVCASGNACTVTTLIAATGVKLEGAANGAQFQSGYGLGFASGASFASMDTSLYRASPGVLAVSTGANSGTGGTIQLAGIQTSPSSTLLTLTAGAVGMGKMTASASAPGATGAKMELVCGTNAGTAKLVIAAGTSATVVTIIDNIGAGVTGC